MRPKPARPRAAPATPNAVARLARAAAKAARTDMARAWLRAVARSADRATERPGAAKPSCEGVQIDVS
jgi:hypothetical protein